MFILRIPLALVNANNSKAPLCTDCLIDHTNFIQIIVKPLDFPLKAIVPRRDERASTMLDLHGI